MKSSTFALASLVASAAIAQPHQHNRHHHNKRMETDVAWVTSWVTDYEYVATTTTVWVSEGFVAPTTTSSSTPSTTSSSSSSTSSKPASSAEIPAQFFEGGDKASTTSSSSVYVAPVPAYTPPAETTTSVAPAPVPTTSTSEAPVYVAPAPVATTTSIAAAYVAPAPAPVSTSSSSSGSSSGECSTGSPCEGDITYYEAGLGACGFTNDGSVDKVVALPHGLMGTQSNGNPYCGRMITVKCTSTGKTTTAKVMDKCMGCVGNSIDLSNAAFDEIADEAVGRTGATWWFSD